MQAFVSFVCARTMGVLMPSLHKDFTNSNKNMCIRLCVLCFTVSTILCYIGLVTSIIIFPLGIAALVLYCLQSKVKGNAQTVI